MVDNVYKVSMVVLMIVAIAVAVWAAGVELNDCLHKASEGIEHVHGNALPLPKVIAT